MKSENKKFIVRISIVGAILLFVTLLLQLFVPSVFIPAHYITIIILWALTLGLFLISSRSLDRPVKTAFVNIFMSASVAKLFVLMMYIILYVFTVGENKKAFLIFILINYVLFTTFEMVFLLTFNKNQKSENQEKDNIIQ